MSKIDYSIKDIEKIVTVDGKIKNVDVSRLTAPGENYLSLVLKVDIDVEEDGKTKTINAVAKKLPLNRDKKTIDFNLQGMKNEIYWYKEIAPLYANFAKKYGVEVNFFPKYYGSRYSLDPAKSDIDDEAVLLLENLSPQGYKNDDRYIGHDLPTAKAIITELALFGVIPIAMKHNKPEYYEILRKFIKNSKLPPPSDLIPQPDHNDLASDKKSSSNDVSGPPHGEHPEKHLLDAMGEMMELSSILPKLKPMLEKPMSPLDWNKESDGPWATLTHLDFWVNNIMINPKASAESLVKIVDFQTPGYRGLTDDLVFFVLTSIRNDVVMKSLDELLRYYYDKFIYFLKQFNVPQELTWEKYLEELRNSAIINGEGKHAIMFTSIIFGEKNGKHDAAVEGFDFVAHFRNMMKNMNQHHREKLIVIANILVNKEWF